MTRRKDIGDNTNIGVVVTNMYLVPVVSLTSLTRRKDVGEKTNIGVISVDKRYIQQ